MLELADVFRRFAPDYLRKYGASMLPSHLRAVDDIIHCRTETLGGHPYKCTHCPHKVYAYHSCKNRSCPKCHGDQTREWLLHRQTEMLPVPYFHVTTTVPRELRDIFRPNQRDLYPLFMKASAEAVIKLARDPRYRGGTVAVLAVLQTWTGELFYHPHVHCLVSGGGISPDGDQWLPARENFLVPVRALSRIVRGKLRDLIARNRPDLLRHVPRDVWKRDWVADCKPRGVGAPAVIDYLARYVFRIAITNSRLVAIDDDTVTFRYKDHDDDTWKLHRLPGEEFMRRFLQHVLPKGLHKVRYYGLWHHSKRQLAQRARLLLEEADPDGHLPEEVEPPEAPPEAARTGHARPSIREGAVCPRCHKGTLLHVRDIPRATRRPTIRGP